MPARILKAKCLDSYDLERLVPDQDPCKGSTLCNQIIKSSGFFGRALEGKLEEVLKSIFKKMRAWIVILCVKTANSR